MATDEGQLLYVPIQDMRRLYEWDEDESSLLADVAAFAGILLLLLIPTLFISKVDPAKTVKAE